MNPEGVSLLAGPLFASRVDLEVQAPDVSLVTGPATSIGTGLLLTDIALADFIGGSGGSQAPPLPTTGIVYPLYL